MAGRIMRGLGWAGLVLLLLFGGLWVAFPLDPVDRRIDFPEDALPDDLDGWLAAQELQFPDIRAGAAKQILWAGAKGARTPLAIVYVHGFSADQQEIRPVPDEVARALGANLFFTRLAGHGRDGAAMAEPVAGDWIEDMAEAMAIGRRLGERVLVIGTSTGATLAAIAATDPDLSRDLAGTVLVSANFGVQSAGAFLLDLPLAPVWGPWVAGAEAGFEPINDGHGRHWTTRYPTTAFFPMAALLREARATDWGAARTPALFLYAPADRVIDPALIPPVAARWGGGAELVTVEVDGDDDPYSHVIAGDILSPGQTEAVARIITDWARAL
ncbi:MAG: hypothetical protein RIR62_2023 [Pseudomonadota bacterium]